MPIFFAVAALGLAAGSMYMQYNAGKDAEALQGLSTEAAVRRNVKEGISQYENAMYTARMKEFEADQVRSQVKAKANEYLVAASYMRSTQKAQAAASGVNVASGSAQLMRQQTDKLARQDALVALYNGIDIAAGMEHQADMIRKAGNVAMLQGSQSAYDAGVTGYGQQGLIKQQTYATLLGNASNMAGMGYTMNKGSAVGGTSGTKTGTSNG